LLSKQKRLELNPMFHTTRFSRPTLKSGCMTTIALLALASFGAPSLSAQPDTPLQIPHYGRSLPNYQQPAPARGASAYRFNINGQIFAVDDNLFVWAGRPLPVGHIVAAGNGRYIATMYSWGGRYWAYPVQ